MEIGSPRFYPWGFKISESNDNGKCMNYINKNASIKNKVHGKYHGLYLKTFNFILLIH
jgi:nitrous oxidase accessory protein NosD